MPYAIAVIAIMCLLCALLAMRLYGAEQCLRGFARRLDEQEATGSGTRLSLDAPNAAAEDLLTAVNRLLARQEQEAAEYHRQEKAIRQQIANVSHDLRTPLTSIVGYLQLLEGDTLTQEERRSYLEIVRGRAGSLQNLITSFYDLSRLEGGEYTLVSQPVDLYGVLSRLCAEFYGDFTQRDLSVTVELSEGLSPIMGDAGAAQRVFSNLLRNAMEHGGKTLVVHLYREGDTIVSSFANEAEGLEAEDVSHVFERFYTADKMRTGQCTGLGLAIVKGLVERMGHRVEARLENGLFTVLVRWKL